MLANIYSVISSCDVLDSETVGAAASLIGETRQLIAEYTGIYKQKLKFFDNVKMETLKQQNRLELLREKYRLDKEKWDNQHPAAEAKAATVDGQSAPPGMVSFGVDDTLTMLMHLDEADQELAQQSQDEAVDV